MFVKKKLDKKNLQVTGYACYPRCHMYMSALSLWNNPEQPMLARLSSYAGQIQVEARNGGQQFDAATMTSETGKKANCSALPEYKTNIEKSIRRPGRSTFSHLGFPHLGPWQHLGATMNSTLDWRGFIVAIPWEQKPQNVTSDAT